MDDRRGFGVKGHIIDTPVLGELRIRERSLVIVADDGTISAVLTPEDAGYIAAEERFRETESLTVLGNGCYLLPGLVDLHNHAPQWPQLGKALDIPLADWLDSYTFPLEARFADVDFARSVYQSLVRATLANGTTTAVYYATAHLPATQQLVETCLMQGQRAVVGRIAMDKPDGCPDYYRDPSAAQAIEETGQLIDFVVHHPANPSRLVLPAATPRFIPSCSDELLQGLGELVGATGCHVQSHCSESDWAHRYGLDRYGRTDTDTYRRFGLLTRRTVLAHCNFVDQADMELLTESGAAVAHCPLSNVYFANAVFPLREALDRGVHVGLGTDVSGGPSPSVLNAVSSAVAVSRLREDGIDASRDPNERGVPGARVTFNEAFWAATTGAGIALDLPIGLLESGHSFDAIAVDTNVGGTDLMVWPELDSAEDAFQKVIHNATRHDITAVWVAGRRVVPAEV